jgi:hypothetical protein
MNQDPEIIIEIFKDFIKTFVRKEKRERLLQFLDKEKNGGYLHK